MLTNEACDDVQQSLKLERCQGVNKTRVAIAHTTPRPLRGNAYVEMKVMMRCHRGRRITDEYDIREMEALPTYSASIHGN
jgi:hypothetical protein